MNNTHIIIHTAALVWRKASRQLGFKLVSPYRVKNGTKVLTCFGFLPHWGSKNGMLIGITRQPDFEIDAALKTYAEKKKMFYSFINPGGYIRYDEAYFKDTLADWGYFGPEDERPSWLVQATGNQ